MLDNNQYIVDSITAYLGDPDQRTTTSMDSMSGSVTAQWCGSPGTRIWIRHRHMRSSCGQDQRCGHYFTRRRLQPITEIGPGESAYVDIRSYSTQWYAGLGLPDPKHNTYVVQYRRHTNWGGKNRNDCNRLVAICDLFDERHIVNHEFVQRYGQWRQLLPHMTLVDKTMLLVYSRRPA
jgi:hypothetical protein